MAKSRKRGGEKAHRKRIQQMNRKVKAQRTAIQKLFDESMKKQLEEYQKNMELESGSTTNSDEKQII